MAIQARLANQIIALDHSPLPDSSPNSKSLGEPDGQLIRNVRGQTKSLDRPKQAFLDHGFVSVKFFDHTIVGSPPHPFRFWRQIPFDPSPSSIERPLRLPNQQSLTRGDTGGHFPTNKFPTLAVEHRANFFRPHLDS
jgi:hypothetical protein